ncbi:hypothetical protein TNCV_3980081 [Trichonephila clavipes]|nr:hypothetical protein TNCV_3980081 [Trichonephila clavipes]
MFMVLETWVRRGGRDFGSGGPMGMQETSAMEVSQSNASSLFTIVKSQEPTQLLQDELFPTSTFNKLHLSPTSQRKPGCFTSSRTLTLPSTINIYDMGWRLASRAICPATSDI